MNQVDQNINKDNMIECDLIDVESLEFSDDQTWLYKVSNDSGEKVDIVDWNLSCDWPLVEDNEYVKTELELYNILDNILRNEAVSNPDKNKFDSRTFVRPKKRVQRPSIQSIMEVPSNPSSISPNPSLNSSANQSANKYLTYNKYNMPNPILRLKTFNVDTNTENSAVIKEYAMKRRSLVQEDDVQLDDIDVTLASDVSDRLSSEHHVPSKPINIDLSQPAHNVHSTFNKGLSNIMNERGSLNMYQSGESLMRMSPPSLVSSLLMDTSGTFNPDSMEGRRSLQQKEIASHLGRDSIDPMMTSMTLSILDEKDMSTSFLSQTTYPDNDSLMDSLPPSLVSSVNSSYIVSNTSKPMSESQRDSNIFSSATFTHLEQSEKLLSARPRCNLYNSFTKRDSSIRNSESYTKSREEACQIDTTKVLNENCDKTASPAPKTSQPDMCETITLHYSNNKYSRDNDPEKENLQDSFEKDDAFYKEMGVARTVDLGKNSLNVTLDKQELNEIIQARQKLSLARKALPTESQTLEPVAKTIQMPPGVTPRQNMENTSEVLSRRRNMNGGHETEEPATRDTPKRNATFKKPSPRASGMDATVVFVKDDQNIIDINSATLNLIDTEKTLQQEEWCSQSCAMVGSCDSTDTGTFSSSSPPEPAPAPAPAPALHHPRTNSQIASTPLVSLKKCSRSDMLNLNSTISPIYDMVNDKSYTLNKVQSANSSGMERTYNMHNATVINSATMVKRSSVKRDILAGKTSPEKRSFEFLPQQRSPLQSRMSPPSTVSYNSMAPPVAVPRKTGLPTSKLRQYSSHKELSRIPGNPAPVSRLASRPMIRRGVYASNPALSPTSSNAGHGQFGYGTGHGGYGSGPVGYGSGPVGYGSGPVGYGSGQAGNTGYAAPVAAPVRRDSYTLSVDPEPERQISRPVVTNPPALVRQGTETLRRERPHSQIVAPKDLRVSSGIHSMRNHHMPPPTTRPYSIASSSQLRQTSRPTSVPLQRPVQNIPVETRPATGAESRVSALPRPSRLPAPRRALRPPSIYSVAPATDMDHY